LLGAAKLVEVYMAPEDMEGHLYDGKALKQGLFAHELEARLVETRLVGAIVDALARGESVVVVGEKGIGKSAAAVVALYEVLKGVVKWRVPAVLEPYFFDAALPAIRKLASSVREASDAGVYPIFYLDPSKLLAYTWAGVSEYKPEHLDAFVEATSVVAQASGEFGVLIVASNDQYGLIKDLLPSARVIDADKVLGEGKEHYVEAIVEEYCGCGGAAAKEVARHIARLEDNYAAAAAIAGYRLRSGVADVEEAVREAVEYVKRFAVHYIRHAVLKDAVRGEGKVGYALLEALKPAGRPGGGGVVARWFSQPLRGTLYGAVEELASRAASRQRAQRV